MNATVEHRRALPEGSDPRTLIQLRADFERRARRSLSLPIAGCIIWSLVGAAGVFLPQRTAIITLLFATGGIFPLAMLIARMRGEELLSNTNPLAQLMGACVFMINLLWALHIPLMSRAPAFVPLSVGISAGLHWVVYSWITRHPVGYAHATTRTLAVCGAWLAFPDHVVTACSVAVVFAYAISIQTMATRTIR